MPKGLTLPGVRSTETAPWPPRSSNHRAPGISSFHSGQVYIDYRRNPTSRYAAKWMGPLHNHYRSTYVGMEYQLSQALSEDSTFESGPESGLKETTGRHLGNIIKLGQIPVIFTALEDFATKWLNLLPRHRQVRCFYPLLTSSLKDQLVSPGARPFVRQGGEAAGRGSVTLDSSTLPSIDVGSLVAIDPRKTLFRVASESQEGLDVSLRRFRIFKHSGIEIPVSRFKQMPGPVQQFNSS